MSRHDGRSADDLRPITITRGWLDHAEGSCLVEFGRTRVLVAASATEGVPRWRKGSGLGWVTAEYAMLPRATHTRSDRESVKGKVGGRTHEISRLVGRSLRAAVDLSLLGENSISVDCDVLQADGGTRTAAITGAWVALADACARLGKPQAMVRTIAAVSVGVVDGVPVLDLDYPEDVSAGTDMNVVATAGGDLIEVQGTAEGAPFSRSRARRAPRPRARRDRPPDVPAGRGAGVAAAGRAPAVTRVVLASRNAGKLAELQRMLPGLELVALDPAFEPGPETAASFEENALAKAREACAHTGLPAVADDSGLSVDALNGMPGVLSARWAGRHGDDAANTALLLAQLGDVPDERRGAGFVCAAAYALPDGREHVVRGELRGVVARAPRGGNGFGYDPVLLVGDRTAGEMAPAEKDAVSHRGQALRALAPLLTAALA